MAETIFTSLAKNELESLKKMLNKLEKTCNERKEKKEKLIYDQKTLLKKKKINAKKNDFLFKLKQEKTDLGTQDFKKDIIKNKISIYKKHYSELMAKVGRKDYKFEDDVNEFSKNQVSRMIDNFHKNIQTVEGEEMTGFASAFILTPEEIEKKIKLDTMNKDLNDNVKSQTDIRENLGKFFDSEGDRGQKRERRHNKDYHNNVNVDKNGPIDTKIKSEDACKKCLKNASKFLNYIKVGYMP